MSAPVSKKPRMLDCSIRPDLLEESVVNSIKAKWKSPTFSHFNSFDVEIISYPFPVCVVSNFLSNPNLLKSVISELKEFEFNQKNNDLYQFQQSCDVRNLTSYTFIPQLYDLIRFEGLNWVKKITDLKLNEEISATFSKYKHKDRLLCHDDKCEDRHIAFILYLVQDWKNDDGGALELFSTDLNFYPKEVVKSISPQFNTFVFFEVTHQSFHQVAEVLSQTKERISLNGWFHFSKKKSDQPNCKIVEDEYNLWNNKIFDLNEFFSFTYLDQMNKIDIKFMFLAESEIQLDEFIVPKLLEELKTDLKSEKLNWSLKKPPNIRKYEVADLVSLTPSLQTLHEVFKSEIMFKYLKSITGLDLVPAETSDLEIWEKGQLPNCSFEVQRWTPSCYTLIHDQDPEFHSEGLDVILRLPFDEENYDEAVSEDVPEAGHIIYIDAESKDEECLLHIGYKMNSLALVFRDNKTLRFTKYLDSTAKPFYQIFCTYHPWRAPANEPNLKHCEESESENSDGNSESLREDEDSEE